MRDVGGAGELTHGDGSAEAAEPVLAELPRRSTLTELRRGLASLLRHGCQADFGHRSTLRRTGGTPGGSFQRAVGAHNLVALPPANRAPPNLCASSARV